MLSPEYRISEAESREACKIWLDEEKYRALSEGERHSIDVLMDAEHAHEKLGRWPVTVEEVYDHWNQEQQECERKRIASWQDEGRISAYDFSCYEEQLAAGDTDGPFVSFMRVAADLKKSGKQQLTVGDVRAEMRRQ
jgi:hypothetical protein